MNIGPATRHALDFVELHDGCTTTMAVQRLIAFGAVVVRLLAEPDTELLIRPNAEAEPEKIVFLA